MKRILVFSKELDKEATAPKTRMEYSIKDWRPSLFRFIPPNTGLPLALLSLAHFFHIFKNSSYGAYVMMHDGRVVSSLVCVPAFYLWPFMRKNDVQFKYVYTHPDYRGKGLANDLILVANYLSYREGRSVWYMTHDKNHASIALCKKAGFEFKGYYRKSQKRLLFFTPGRLYDG
ncbi:MAG: GNAT family N-acetyltransferase [Bacteroidales bacterium]|nr:GNAT family N-acetyltransferase [Bacteroidales bacterium]